MYNELDLQRIIETRVCKPIMFCRRSRRTVQQIQRYGFTSSWKSSISHEHRLQVCRWYGRLLLETLTVHEWTSCRMSIRLVVSGLDIL